MSFETSDYAFKLFTEAYGKAWSASMPTLKTGETAVGPWHTKAIQEGTDIPSSVDEALRPPCAADDPLP